MKLYCTAFLTACLISVGTLTARAEVYDLSTVTGKTYHQCRVLKIELDGVSFRHANGVAKVLFRDLTPQWRSHFGYDAEKAKAHEVKLKDDKAKARAAAEKRAAEIAAAQKEALNVAQENAMLQTLQAALLNQSNTGYGISYNGIMGTAGYPQAPYFTQEQVVDGRRYYVASRRDCGPLVTRDGHHSYDAFTGGGSAGVGPIVSEQRIVDGRRYYVTGRRGSPVFGSCGVAAPSCLNAGSTVNGFTPTPFFAVRGVGPNVAMPGSARCAAPVMGGFSHR